MSLGSNLPPHPWLLSALTKREEKKKKTQTQALAGSLPVCAICIWGFTPESEILIGQLCLSSSQIRGLTSFLPTEDSGGLCLSLIKFASWLGGLFYWLNRHQWWLFIFLRGLPRTIKMWVWIIIQVPSSPDLLDKSMCSNLSFASYSLGDIGKVISPLCASVSPSIKCQEEN